MQAVSGDPGRRSDVRVLKRSFVFSCGPESNRDDTQNTGGWEGPQAAKHQPAKEQKRDISPRSSR